MSNHQELRYPTKLQLTGDIIFAPRDAEDGTGLIRAFFFDTVTGSVTAHLVSACTDEERDGWFTIRHMPAATCPLRLFDRGDEYMRRVPEEVDGSGPGATVMDWVDMMYSGVGVVQRLDLLRRRGLLVGLTYLGESKGWHRFDVRFKFTEEDINILPPTQSLVNFEGILERQDVDGVPIIRTHQLDLIGMADPALIDILR
ncbi:hypothetical protein OC834_005203 [Tilletia horrida]|uniref:Uncharacterized protein n=1 Tax=Tilletia horrida TaxID=155126 RepID=A0AAN6G7T4_9BASI|nr:hypothetical protein OC842_006143 [Tilletia horrida]KAK0525359.1 hypothetical protein OC834_005203 [Tilletia horrida]KAK0555915.1 hypothetical protein OC844_005991 [Tilletia horrida]